MSFGSSLRSEDHLAGRRGLLYQEITVEPGIHQRELQRRTGIPMGTMVHHLNVLQNLGYVDSQYAGPMRRYAPHGTPPKDYGQAALYASEPLNSRVIDIVAEQPGIRQRSVMSELSEYPRSTVQMRLNRLTNLGLLRKSHRPGTSANYWLNEE